LNENPSHKSKSKTNDLVKRPVSEWLDEILESLDQDQKNVVMTFLKGHHIILVSGAGCGKTYVLKRLYRLVMAMYGNEWFLNHVKAIGTTNIIANNLSHLYFQGNYPSDQEFFFLDHFFLKLSYCIKVRLFIHFWGLALVKEKIRLKILEKLLSKISMSSDENQFSTCGFYLVTKHFFFQT
jgi:ABC-type oligopeptide transport system ATPase subunit